MDFDCERLFVDRGLPDPPTGHSGTLVQVIGESGMGKSTQLQQWRRKTPGPFHYIARQPYRDRWASPPPAEAVGTIYGDEIDRMPKPLRAKWFRSLARAGTTLIIGTHVDLSALGRRCGFTVTSHYLQPIDHETLRQIVDARLKAFATGSTPRLTLSDADIDLVLEESDGIPGRADVALHCAVAHRVT